MIRSGAYTATGLLAESVNRMNMHNTDSLLVIERQLDIAGISGAAKEAVMSQFVAIPETDPRFQAFLQFLQEFIRLQKIDSIEIEEQIKIEKIAWTEAKDDIWKRAQGRLDSVMKKYDKETS